MPSGGAWIKGWIQRIAGNPSAWAVFYERRAKAHATKAAQELEAVKHCQRRARQWARKARGGKHDER